MLTTKFDEAGAGISRVLTHASTKKLGFIIAFRGNYSLSENRIRNKELAHDILTMSYGYIKIDWAYIEADNAKVVEESFIVIADLADSNFIDIMCKLRDRYNQDAVMIGNNEDGFYYYEKDRDRFYLGDRISLSNIESFYSTVKNRKFIISNSCIEVEEVKSAIAKLALKENRKKFLADSFMRFEKSLVIK